MIDVHTEQAATGDGRGRERAAHLTRARERGARDGAERLARGLGWFSIGLGLAELAAPRGLSRLIGLRAGARPALRMTGLREIAAGVGLLARPRARGWM